MVIEHSRRAHFVLLSTDEISPCVVGLIPWPLRALNQRFIEAMVLQHECVLVIARNALQKAEWQEVKDFAHACITTQEAEIAQMRHLLKQWYSIEH